MVINPVTGKLDCIGGNPPPGFGCSLADNQAATDEMGAGTWQASGGITFTASYSNGTPTSGPVTYSGWASELDLTNSFQGPTASTAAVSYPASLGGTVVFTLTPNSDNGPTSCTDTHTFYNERYWGISTKTSGYTLTDMQSFGASDLTNAVTNTFTVNPGPGQYIVYSYPSRLGTATFTVNNFQGGFVGPETDSITNSSGYIENYYTYTSANANLATVTVQVTTP